MVLVVSWLMPKLRGFSVMLAFDTVYDDMDNIFSGAFSVGGVLAWLMPRLPRMYLSKIWLGEEFTGPKLFRPKALSFGWSKKFG